MRAVSLILQMWGGKCTRASVEQDARNEGGSPRRQKRVSLFSGLSRLAPSVTRVLLDGPRIKRDCSKSTGGIYRNYLLFSYL